MTELREQFFAEVRTDPYAHMLFRMQVRAWAFGFEAALKECGIERTMSFSELEDKAAEILTSEQKKYDAQALVAMAQIGSMLP